MWAALPATSTCYDKDKKRRGSRNENEKAEKIQLAIQQMVRKDR